MSQTISAYCYINDQPYPIYRLYGYEKISQPFQFNIELRTTAAVATQLQCLAPVRIELTHPHLAPRHIAGIVTNIEQAYHAPHVALQITMSSKLSLLQHESIPRLFNATPLAEILTQLTDELNLLDSQFNFRQLSQRDKLIEGMQVPTETTLHFLQRLLSELNIYFWSDNQSQHEILHFLTSNHGCPYLSSAQLIYQTQLWIDQHSVTDLQVIQNNQQQLQGKSQLTHLQPGYCSYLNADELHASLSTDYIIGEVKHFFQCENAGEMTYYNQFIAQPKIHAFAITSLKPPPFAKVFIGTIASNSQRYPVALDHISQNQPGTYPTVRLLTELQSSKQRGFATPLQQGTEVLLSCVDGDPLQPIILGSLLDGDKAPIITAQNAQHHVLRTPSANTCLFDDNLDTAQITLHTKDQANGLALIDNHQQSIVKCYSQQGNISLQAKQTIQLHSDETQKVCCDDDISFHSHNDFYITSLDKNIQLQSDKHLRIRTQHELAFKMGHEFQCHAENDLQITAGNDLQLSLQGDNASCDIKSKTISCVAQQDIIFQNTGNGDIRLGNQNTSIELTANGDVIIHSQQVNLLSDEKLKLTGKILFDSHAT